MVISEIRALYNDENDLLRPVTKRIYEDYNPERKQWMLKKVEYLFGDPEFPVPSDTPEISVETRHGWLIPPDWEFVSEVWAYERRSPRSEIEYDYESTVFYFFSYK